MHIRHAAQKRKPTAYISEFTQFIGEFIRQHPEVTADQERGWHIYWDREVPVEQLTKSDEDRVPVKSYYYF